VVAGGWWRDVNVDGVAPCPPPAARCPLVHCKLNVRVRNTAMAARVVASFGQ